MCPVRSVTNVSVAHLQHALTQHRAAAIAALAADFGERWRAPNSAEQRKL